MGESNHVGKIEQDELLAVAAAEGKKRYPPPPPHAHPPSEVDFGAVRGKRARAE